MKDYLYVPLDFHTCRICSEICFPEQLLTEVILAIQYNTC